jgi:deoxyribodipyrimidine photo-lyase
MIHPDRIRRLNDHDPRKGRYVLYWMQASQRERYNHALEYAATRANALNQPLVVGFALTDAFPEANLRHYRFMLEGLRELAGTLRDRGIPLALRLGDPAEVIPEIANDASLLVTDCGYLRVQRRWRAAVAGAVTCPAIRVESDAVVPVETVSDKREYAARTIRPKIHRLLDEYKQRVVRVDVDHDGLSLDLGGESLDDIDVLLDRLEIDRSVAPVTGFYAGGEHEAHRRLDRFVREALSAYHQRRGEPSEDIQSNLSPYLHFGQVSPLAVALTIDRTGKAPDEAKEAFLEELIVRRELSLNLCRFEERYDEYAMLPGWARETLEKHKNDKRPATYDRATLEAGETGDEYWNAAQREMMTTGKMHNTMRMYWGKRILEWTPDPAEAFRIALELNNKYELDGRDPNSYAGVAWCFGNHDRPWPERDVFGTVRTMTASGLDRKYDMAGYLGGGETVRR